MRSKHSGSAGNNGNGHTGPEKTQDGVYVLFIDRNRMIDELVNTVHIQTRRIKINST
jgi:hypothetical protein